MSESTPRIKVSRSRSRLYQSASPSSEENAKLATAPAESAESAEFIDYTELAIVDATDSRYRRNRAEHTLQYHAAVSGTVGALPLPIVDMLAVSALQLHLIRELSRIYGVDFSGQRAKAAIAALLGGAQTGLMVSSVFKYVPIVGYVIASIPAAAAAGGITYAVGKVFIYHFELGGTLLDFDAEKLKAYFKAQLK
jgi:uncharacterized protein (DUF697 family)